MSTKWYEHHYCGVLNLTCGRDMHGWSWGSGGEWAWSQSNRGEHADQYNYNCELQEYSWWGPLVLKESTHTGVWMDWGSKYPQGIWIPVQVSGGPTIQRNRQLSPEQALNKQHGWGCEFLGVINEYWADGSGAKVQSADLCYSLRQNLQCGRAFTLPVNVS